MTKDERIKGKELREETDKKNTEDLGNNYVDRGSSWNLFIVKKREKNAAHRKQQ